MLCSGVDTRGEVNKYIKQEEPDLRLIASLPSRTSNFVAFDEPSWGNWSSTEARKGLLRYYSDELSVFEQDGWILDTKTSIISPNTDDLHRSCRRPRLVMSQRVELQLDL